MSYNYKIIQTRNLKGVAEFVDDVDSIDLGTLYDFDQLRRLMIDGNYPGHYKDSITRTLKWVKDNYFELLL